MLVILFKYINTEIIIKLFLNKILVNIINKDEIYPYPLFNKHVILILKVVVSLFLIFKIETVS